MWTDLWVGKRFEELARGPESYDCLGLFLAVYELRKGLRLPDPACTVAQAVRRDLLSTYETDLIEVTLAEEGDIVLFGMGRDRLHVGYALDNRDMLHVEQEGIGSTVERFRSAQWRGRMKGIYRYV